MAKRLSEKQKGEILRSFLNGKTIDDLSEEFKCTKLTISRNIKKNLGEKNFKDFINKSKFGEKSETLNDPELKQGLIKDTLELTFPKDERESINTEESQTLSTEHFVEILPLDHDIDNSPQKELSSVPISAIDFPKVVYIIVDKKIELETKFLNEYPEWQFLPNEDLNRKTIEIFDDIKSAKRKCSKDHKVIKVPNTDVFNIVAPILISRGITRIINSDKLIAL